MTEALRPPAMPRFVPPALASCAVTLLIVVAAVLGPPARTASAHNTLVSSDPADGATLESAPTEVIWSFDNSVPLETLTVTLVDATGARRELPGSTYGDGGDTQVVTPLPPLEPGNVSLRWRLVGPDGHPITGRVAFAISGAAPTSAAPTSTTPAPGAPAPGTTAPDDEATVVDVDVDVDVDGAYSTPAAVRWLIRSGSYLAILAVVGILFSAAYVWPGAGSHPLLRRVLSRSLIATAILGFLQLLVVASDVSGRGPWASFGAIGAATTTIAGMAFMLRIVLASALWIVLFQYRIGHGDVYWTAISIPGLGLLATWAFAGHSRSMRWPALGVASDVLHHAAAAAWIAGLAIVGWILIPKVEPDTLVPALRNFSRLAAVSVGVLVATGSIQSVRLVGGPSGLLDAVHGRYLVAKLVVLVAMLAIANANRRRVDTRLGDVANLDRHVGSLRRAVVTEFTLGLVIIGITAALVVSPPATSEPGAAPRGSSDVTAIYYDL